jgi:CheY-like chemotaxis protein
VASEPGAGTTVRLYFPAAVPGSAPVAGAEPAVPRRELGLRLLLVEDNVEVAAALRDVLEALGCQVHAVHRAQAALAWLSQQDALPDLMLSDVLMPGDMDGAELARRVRDGYPGVKIILMTGYAEQLEAISRLGFDILPKPCSADMLADAINKAMARAPRPPA